MDQQFDWGNIMGDSSEFLPLYPYEQAAAFRVQEDQADPMRYWTPDPMPFSNEFLIMTPSSAMGVEGSSESTLPDRLPRK